jgi:NAD(P)H-nitrite reductase large subunit
MTRYVLIGSGVAAVAAAEGIRTADPDGSITIISNDPDGYYSRPGLAYLLTGEIDTQLLFPFRAQDFKRLNIHLRQAKALRIRPAEKSVEIHPAAVVAYDRLLLATGASARPLTMPGSGLQGVNKLDHLEDARRLIQLAGNARSAVVVGGGITALELVEGLIARRVTVHYILRGKRFWSNVLDESESEMIENRLRKEGVILHPQREIVEIQAKNERVGGVRLDNGEQIKCEIVAYAIGTAPRTDLAREAGILCDRGILVNETFHTNQAHIYAAGDAAQIFDPDAKKYLLDSLWSSARAQGFIAGQNMAGRSVIYQKPVSFNVTRLTGLAITIIGAVGSAENIGPVEIVRGDSESWREVPLANVAEQETEHLSVRLMVGEKQILGAVVMGAPELSAPLLTLIRDRVDITPIRDQLLTPSASIEKILLEFQRISTGV